MSEPRYFVVDESSTGHCCFSHSVCDRAKPTWNYERTEVISYETVCECFCKNMAELIARALNER